MVVSSISNRKVKELRQRIGVGNNVANELLILSGGDVDLATHASADADGLDQCKAFIIDRRFRQIEEHMK